ncbi:tryptophan synthase beta subunit-like PLP-dependent enzyme [Pavlovales sp. CCMP2436]|nr:tryptophan synthase beta subunit-like PLP-dependent enzyme [Pavlovales sp. CCMP2436]
MLETLPFANFVPGWARALRLQPESKVCLAMLPTPLHEWRPPCLEPVGFASCLIKRDDMSGGPDLGGNKVRKLELLLADAKARGCDTILTIGGIQSNHCRATAVAARLVGLDSSLILRVSDQHASDISDIGFGGNLLFGRLAGATVKTVTKRNYSRHGSDALLRVEEARLIAAGKRPYVVPVGGSTALAAWGYLAAVQELLDQLAGRPPIEHIVVACGSGGTATAIALGVRLAGLRTRVHAIAVCDTPEYFYAHAEQCAAELGVDLVEGGAVGLLTVHQGKGTGYGMSTAAELRTLTQTAAATGVTLDSTYTGKALHAFAELACAAPELFRETNVLFWHTGGAVGDAGGTLSGALAPMMPAGQVAPLLLADGIPGPE